MATYNYGMPLQTGTSPSGIGASGNLNAATTNIVGTSLQTPELNLSGVDFRSSSAAEAQMRGYSIDIYNDIKYYKTAKHPMLSLMGAGAKPVDHYEYIISETNEDEQYFDLEFDKLRTRNFASTVSPTTALPNAYNYYKDAGLNASASTYGSPLEINQSAYIGGQLIFHEVAADDQILGNDTTPFADFGVIQSILASASTSGIVSTAAITFPQTSSKAKAATTTCAITAAGVSYDGVTARRLTTIGFDGTAPYASVQGSVTQIIEKHRANLFGAGWTIGNTFSMYNVASTAVTWQAMVKNSRSQSAFMLFDNLAMYNADGDYVQLDSVKVAIAAFAWDSTGTRFIFVLDLDETNRQREILTLLGPSVNKNIYLQLKEFSVAGDVFNTDKALEGFTYISPVMLLGDVTDTVEGIPEGSRARNATNYKRNFSARTNNVQIFRSKAWSLTGTRAACRNPRFIDDWKDQRDRNLAKYKDDITGAMLWGTKSRSSMWNDDEKRYDEVYKTGGLLDRETNPIRYFKFSLPVEGSTPAQTSANLFNFIEGIGDAYSAWMPNKKDLKITIPVSPTIVRYLRRIVAISQTGQNYFGYDAQGAPQKGSMDLGFDVTTFRCAAGTINFIEEPALDFMTKMKLPYYITAGKAQDPRMIGFALDMASFGMRTLVADKLQGNLQAPDEDIKLKEDIIGTHGFEVIKPRSQSVILFS